MCAYVTKAYCGWRWGELILTPKKLLKILDLCTPFESAFSAGSLKLMKKKIFSISYLIPFQFRLIKPSIMQLENYWSVTCWSAAKFSKIHLVNIEKNQKITK